MAKKLLALVMMFALLCPAAFGVNAPYEGYYYDSWGEMQTCPNIYTPKYEYFQVDMGMETALNNPSDMYMDEENALAMRFGITSIPFVALIKNGEVVGKSLGYRQKDDLLSALGL